MNIDDEILQEFLVEAGELFDQLNDQFSELDNNREDSELINAIFRAYHTIKGGAGFMGLTAMVEVCHRAEDIIDQLRQNKRQVSDEMIDVMFQVLDSLELMFATVRAGETLEDADSALIQQLDNLLVNTSTQEAIADETISQEKPEKQSSQENENVITEAVTVAIKSEATEPDMDDEFEAMIASADITGTDVSSKVAPASDLISDDEFEAVLDNLHGKGKHGETSSTAVVIDKTKSDLITDDEFEAALDNLHGKGKGPTDTLNKTTESKTKPDEVINNTKVPETDAPVAKPSATIKSVPKNTKAARPPTETSVRVDTARLDDIMNLVGELVLVRNRLSTLKEHTRDTKIEDAISTLELVTSELQGSVMKTRMQPIKKVFSRFPRVIRDLARQLKKDINLELIGEETDLDKSLVEALADPLIHLVRNAADHGIESPEQRFKTGKPRQGKVTLSAKQEGDQILLTVTDDGKGMDHNILRKGAAEKGMMSEDAARSLSNKEAYNLIFAPGFSTKTEISDVSGRGVGMDVVKTRINELSGNVEIDSVLGVGSVISIYLPLTLAILPTLMVKLSQYQFALPLSNVLEAFNMVPEQINIVDGQQVIRVRDKPLPLFFLSPWLVNDSHFDGAHESQKVIVVQMGNKRFGLVVDHIAGQEEVVIKPLGTMLTNIQGFAGATITGDGGIALIIDVPSLITTYAANSSLY